MQTKKVTVLPYDPAWKEQFEQIKAELLSAVGEYVIAVEHVGSTSVEGMSAKPCIDVDMVIEDYSVFDAVAEGLTSLGYYHEGDLGIKEREAFGYTDKPHLQKHHLYVCPKTSRELHRHITFREFLRSHPRAAEEYSRTKGTLFVYGRSRRLPTGH